MVEFFVLQTNAFRAFQRKGGSSSRHAIQNEDVRMRIHIYSMAVKGVYEISVSVGNKVRMFGRDLSLFIVRGDVGVRLTVGGVASLWQCCQVLFYIDDRCMTVVLLL